MDSHKTGFRPIRVQVNLHFIPFSLFEKEVPLVTTEKGILALDFDFIPLLQFTTVFFRGCYHARIKLVPFCALFCEVSPSMLSISTLQLPSMKKHGLVQEYE